MTVKRFAKKDVKILKWFAHCCKRTFLYGITHVILRIRTIAHWGNLPVRLGLGFGVKVRVSFRGVGATRELSPRKIAPWLILGLGTIFLRGNCPRTVILLLLKILLKRSVAVVVQLVAAVVVGAVVVTVVVQLQCSGSRGKTSFSLTSFRWKLKYHKNWYLIHNTILMLINFETKWA